MNPSDRSMFAPAAGRRAAGTTATGLVAILSFAAALVAGCGGGGGDAATAGSSTAPATASTAAYTQGTITGFGSVIVNGVRFDESTAAVTDEDGSLKAASSLRLGMRVEVDSAKVDASTATARASAVRYGAQVLGPVSAVAATSITVLGQVVDITATTVFDDSLVGGLAAVAVGAVVKVHGLADAATGHIVATRVEPETGATAYRLRGTVASLDTTFKTFAIGGAVISYADLAASQVPDSLANGVALRVKLATTPANGAWVAQSLHVKASKPADTSVAHLRGAITAFTSATAFTVDGLVVDAGNAAFPDGIAGVVLGAQVEVHGTVSNGVLVATRVSIESKHRGDDDRKLELHGAITAVDATAKTFVLRGVTVSVAGTVTYTGGTEAGLVVGAKVAVRGGVGSTRTQVLAVTIKFES